MLIDTHIHVGQFFKDYFSPLNIHELVEKIGLNYYAVSSTTQCEENYLKVLDELHELIQLDGKKVLPVMWITPESLSGNIAWYLESDINWKMLKIHPFLNKIEWSPNRPLIYEVIDIARELNLPLLIHTGEDSFCNANLFENVIKANPDITFILAHGRPLFKTLEIIKHYHNAFVDSAFMPIQDISILLQHKLSHKILWGTDMCIPKHFNPSENIYKYYFKKLKALKSITSIEEYEQVTFMNAIRLFKLV